jgi:hypothetical protein
VGPKRLSGLHAGFTNGSFQRRPALVRSVTALFTCSYGERTLYVRYCVQDVGERRLVRAAVVDPAGERVDQGLEFGGVDWFNNRRLHSAIGDVPPHEHETNYYAQHQPQPAAGVNA